MDYLYGLFCCLAGYAFAFWVVAAAEMDYREDLHERQLACIQHEIERGSAWDDARKWCQTFEVQP